MTIHNMRIGEQLVGIVPVAKIRNSLTTTLKNYTHKNKFTINMHIMLLLILLLLKLKARMYVCY